ncbi:MAG: c-type heme family protein [Planctomycetota bacterium]|jgi:hypothetical protein
MLKWLVYNVHGDEEKVKPAIRLFLKRKYPFDEAFGYKEGDLRGGISITVFPELLNLDK